jgi:lipoprotein-anchoring transpeptidase ErfK/SrfK
MLMTKDGVCMSNRNLKRGLSIVCLTTALLGTAAILPETTWAGSGTNKTIQTLKRGQDRWIEIDLSTQRLIAWEGKTWVSAVIVSTGKASTPTPTGVFDIYVKYRTARMQGDDYDIPDVPHVMYFSGGYGFHGAYWHKSFGTPVSHGCINLAPDKARWLYNFASVGTPVVIHQ